MLVIGFDRHRRFRRSQDVGQLRSIAVGSGLGAVTAALLTFVATGDHVLVADNVYGPTRRVCERLLSKFGVHVTFYEPLVGAGIAASIRPTTKVVYVESPGSLTFEVQDVPAIAAAAHAAGAVVIADNTWATPLYIKPFEHGVDLSIQAVTKYICGHADVMGGVITTTEAVYRSGANDVVPARRLSRARRLLSRTARHAHARRTPGSPCRDRARACTLAEGTPRLPDDPGHAVEARL